MKKLWNAGICTLLCAVLLGGCGDVALEADADVVYVDKDGGVTSMDVGVLDQEYYSEEELRTFVEDKVADYTEKNGKGTVKLDSITVEDGTAKLRMKYETVEDYTAFSGIELYQGKVVKALAAGYDFDTDFVAVKDGTVQGSASIQDIYAEDNLKAVIIRANIDVRVAGDICYVSSQNVEVTGTNMVSIREEGTPEGSFETEVYTYIIYR